MALNSSLKWKYTLQTTFILLLLFNPIAFKLVHSLLSPLLGPIANSSGCPTFMGLIVHAIVFTLVLRLKMGA